MTTVAGWCPGALRPMQTGDGLLVRVKPRGNHLSFAQADQVAALARRDGNGQIDLTSRANLQIRGVAPDTLDRLLAGLGAVGLLDPDAGSEAVRNIVVSPLAGLDPSRPDVRPLVAALERQVADDPRLHRLPAKWTFVIDDGGCPSLAGVASDVRIGCDRSGAISLWLDGCGEPAAVPADLFADVVSRLGALACAVPVPLRMRAIMARERCSAAALLGLQPAPLTPDRRPRPTLAGLLGAQRFAFGLTPAFGSLSAEALGETVAVLRAAGGTEFRLTPWRVLLAPGVDASRVASHVLQDAGVILDADDPRLAVSACVGAPACHRATTPTRLHAATLAGYVGDRVHLSGCAKGCGQSGPAPWTLVGHDGSYDVVAHGTAQDAPVARRLSFPDAASWISRAGGARTA